MLVSSTSGFPDNFADMSLLDFVPVAILMTDPSGHIVLVNQQAESLFGYAREALLGQPIELLVPARSRASHPRLRSGYLEQPSPRAMGVGRTLYAIHSSGAEIPVEIGLRPIDVGERSFVLSTIMDITERKLGDQVTARLAAIVRTAHIAMIAYAPDGTITDWNPAAEQLYGYSESEMIGQSIYRLIPAEVEGETRAIVARIMQGDTVDYLETDRLRKSGERVRVSLTLSPIQSRNGAIVGISAIARDITQRVALERQLRQANEKLADRTERLAAQARQLKRANLALEHSNEELQQFASVVSHDLQAPLRSINGFLQLLRDDYLERLDDQARDWIQRVLDSVQKLQSLIRDLLSYARLDAQAEHFEPADMAAIFDDTVRLFEGTAADLQARLTRDELPVVSGVPAQLASVLENLIDNALKYRGREAPRVHVAVEPDEHFWRFSVRDNGIGIDPEFHEQIFDIFRRLHSETEYSGTGIGLAICRRVIARHGGKMWLDSSEGRGSTFHFTLPRS